jgi:hypothetical protein
MLHCLQEQFIVNVFSGASLTCLAQAGHRPCIYDRFIYDLLNKKIVPDTISVSYMISSSSIQS